MKCTVLLFAQLRDSVKSDRLTIELHDTATVGDAMEILCQQHRAIHDMRGRIAVAVDEKYCRTQTRLIDGCTIALIPPVSGG